ncbi:MAG: CDP-6-deoxy-delta-3,4-glucoseen reductase [Rhodocyclaceae bacterium]|nr:CDP-6-deoxy-delta-3,4-glucoseen reductase [Rhodocyclaceae bacterium]MBX3668797.1 CDP-6-deoxy-delta-3,4-glucoseen reductase [Rhodocyclaceae bacterium]
MAFKITLQPSRHSFPCVTDQSVLQAAMDHGFIMPYGCRNGACGSCKGRVLEGAVDHAASQDSALPAAERAAGLALFCCARPLSDLVVECREVGCLADIPVRKLPVRVQKMQRVAPDVMVLYLKLPANERLLFLAGQYVDILLKDGRRRSFSIANAPHDDAFLQLHLRLVPDGHFTRHVFEDMKEREILRIEGPLGSFYLREDSRKPMLLVAGGTGYAPIRALIEHALHNHCERDMVLYWGARDPAGLYLDAEPQRWAAMLPNFRYVPVLSDATPEHGWTGRRGLVHQAVMEDFPDMSGHQVYACGAPAMIDAARADFSKQCRLPLEEFYADSFTFAADSSP